MFLFSKYWQIFYREDILEIELPYLSEIKLKKRTAEKTYVCFNKGVFDIEEINKNSKITEFFEDYKYNMNSINRDKYLSLCSVEEFQNLFFTVAECFTKEEPDLLGANKKTINNLAFLLCAGEEKSSQALFGFHSHSNKFFKLKENLLEKVNQQKIYNEQEKINFLFLILFFFFVPDKKENLSLNIIGEKEIEKFNIVEDNKKFITRFYDKIDIFKICDGQICIPQPSFDLGKLAFYFVCIGDILNMENKEKELFKNRVFLSSLNIIANQLENDKINFNLMKKRDLFDFRPQEFGIKTKYIVDKEKLKILRIRDIWINHIINKINIENEIAQNIIQSFDFKKFYPTLANYKSIPKYGDFEKLFVCQPEIKTNMEIK